MRRPKYELWETEARDATERLRRALALLLEQEMAHDAGAAEGQQFFEALNTVNRTKETAWPWWVNLERPNRQCEDIASRRPIGLSWLSAPSALCR